MFLIYKVELVSIYRYYHIQYKAFVGYNVC